MPDPVNAAAPVRAAAGPAPAADLSLLRQANPKLDELLQSNPAVARLLERNAARGAIAEPRPGDVQTRYSWPVWTHSPQSSPGMTQANEKDVIVVWQETGGAQRVSLGRGREYAGQIVAVHQVDERGGHSAASDKGYLWPSMNVVANGKQGEALKMQWAVVTLDAQGNAVSGGFPGGWSGRTFQGTHGKSEYIPLKG